MRVQRTSSVSTRSVYPGGKSWFWVTGIGLCTSVGYLDRCFLLAHGIWFSGRVFKHQWEVASHALHAPVDFKLADGFCLMADVDMGNMGCMHVDGVVRASAERVVRPIFPAAARVPGQL